MKRGDTVTFRFGGTVYIGTVLNTALTGYVQVQFLRYDEFLKTGVLIARYLKADRVRPLYAQEVK